MKYLPIPIIYSLIYGLIHGAPLKYIKFLEKKNPKTDKDEKMVIWLGNYLSAWYHWVFFILVPVWAGAIYYPIRWLFFRPFPTPDLQTWGIAISLTLQIILTIKLNWPREPSEIKECNQN